MEAATVLRIRSEKFPVTVLPLASSSGKKYVVRDDLLPGGSKQRAAIPWIRELKEFGYRHMIYASPFCGYAQVAVAIACEELGLTCTIVAERDQRFVENCFHPFTELARSHGARIAYAENLNRAHERASEIEDESSLSYQIPLGLNSPRFREIFKDELMSAWELLQMTCRPRRVWLPLGSGTLARVMDSFLPADITIHCVNVHVLDASDERLTSLCRSPRIRLHSAPMAFHEKAEALPKVPSNIYYDAKVWSFLENEGEDGDLWWNVGP